MKYISLFILFFAFTVTSFAQTEEQRAEQKNLVQFSGLILDGSDENLYPIPFTNVIVKGSGRGTYSDLKGFFSIVVRKGDKIEFSTIGYKAVEFVIPDTLQDNHYSLVQLMTQDTINLPETIVFPWPSRDHLKLEFLAMDVTSEMQERAIENLAEESLRRQRNEISLDGNEHADYYLRQQAKTYYYAGQTPPMNIFNPVAWGQFIEAWKRGDFKKKKKKETKKDEIGNGKF